MKQTLQLIIACIFISFLSAGCATTPKLTPAQIQEMTTRTVAATNENAFRATLKVFQNRSYQIKQAEMDSGLILAAVGEETAFKTQLLQMMLFSSYDKDVVIELTATVDKLAENSEEIRLKLQATRYSNKGEKTSVKQLDDVPEMYQELFDEILAEVEKREAAATVK